MADFENIATQFVSFYYKTFDENRSQLAALYREHSMLTFERQAVLGGAGIVEKLTNLPFTQVIHATDTVDAQPSGEDGGILVLVTGKLQTDERPMSFVQTFQLKPENGSYYVFNDVFRLVYPAA